jgi:hypothetical protein
LAVITTRKWFAKQETAVETLGCSWSVYGSSLMNL